MRSIMTVVSMAGTAITAAIGVGVAVEDAFAGVAGTEFRIVERTGQTQATPADGVLNFAVQVRVNGGGQIKGLSTFSFSVTITGEPETSGVITRDRTTSLDGTYFDGFAGMGVGANVGLPRHYAYYAGINPNFNGLINNSAATWMQTPVQDIGLITGTCVGQNLLSTPGVDVDEDGEPDTAVFGPGQPRATLPASIMHDYFAADNWVDVYRFRYTLTDFSPRNLNLMLGGDGPGTTPSYTNFTQVVSALGLWGPEFPGGDVLPAPGNQGIVINVVPTPATTTLAVIPALALAVRRRRTITL